MQNTADQSAHPSIQTSILYGLGDVFRRDGAAAFDVGDSAGDSQSIKSVYTQL